jgi:hypothetical protein
MTKQGTFLSGAALLAVLLSPASALAGTVTYADPKPAGASYPGCLDTGPTGNDGGIGYEWTVELDGKDQASVVNAVGAKSWNEPPPLYTPPDSGWTHTSNWIALKLHRDAKVIIEVERQEGVAIQNGTTTAAARNKLIPAISVYKGWDNTSCEDHRYNTGANFDWSSVEFIGNEPNEKGRSVAKFRAELPAGEYSIAIGGNPKVLKTYPANNCDPTDPVCYAYTGRHGYEATITAKRLDD